MPNKIILLLSFFWASPFWKNEKKNIPKTWEFFSAEGAKSLRLKEKNDGSFYKFAAII